MKYRLYLCFLFGIAICSCHDRSGQANSTYNLNFEEINQKTGLPAGWGLGNVAKSDIPDDSTLHFYHADAVIKKSGKYSLLIDWSRGNKEWTASNYIINKAFEGRKIKLTGYLKTENVTGGAGLWMRIDGEESTLAFDNMESRPVTGTTDWKEYSIELDYDQQYAKKIVVGGLIAGTGKLWMDDFHISIDGKDIKDAKLYNWAPFKAELDTAFNKSSGITSINTDTGKIHMLTNLGMLWGFIKYYHSAVNKGEYNMDAELFRVLPKLLSAGNKDEENKIMEQWVDHFGVHDTCTDSGSIKKSEKIKLMPDYGYLFDNNNLPQSLIKKLDFIRRNRNPNIRHYYELNSKDGDDEFKSELPYDNDSYPDAGIRLMTLYRFWNIIQYYYPYRHLMGEDWNKVLTEFIPVFCSAKDTLAFDLACLQLIARVHGTHANLVYVPAIEQMKGRYTPYFKTAFVEDKLVVTGFFQDKVSFSEKHKVFAGDVIEAIDGVPVPDLIKKYLPITAASSYERQLSDMSLSSGYLLRGRTPTVHLQILRDGKSSEVDVQRVYNVHDEDGDDTPHFNKVIANNIGYLYPASLIDGDLDTLKVKFKDTKGIIIDMRRYPHIFIPYTYGAWLKPISSPFVIIYKVNKNVPGQFLIADTLYNGSDTGTHYNGKIVIIVNHETQSQGEFTTMAFATIPGAVVIGSTTSGDDLGDETASAAVANSLAIPKIPGF